MKTRRQFLKLLASIPLISIPSLSCSFNIGKVKDSLAKDQHGGNYGYTDCDFYYRSVCLNKDWMVRIEKV